MHSISTASSSGSRATGQVNFNNNIDTGTTGNVLVAGGNLGGSGRINGALSNGNATTPGGTISPGNSTGTLTVDGNFTPHSSGRLAIELGGKAAGQFDVLQVIGVANLAGTVDVSLVNNFVPQVGDMFTIITSTVGLGNQGGITLDPADVPFYQLMVNAGAAGNAMLKVIAAPGGGITGDFNNNGVVDAADYVLWRNGGPLMNDPTNGVQPEDYGVWRELWQSQSGQRCVVGCERAGAGILRYNGAVGSRSLLGVSVATFVSQEISSCELRD